VTVIVDEFIFARSGRVGDLDWTLVSGSGTPMASEPGTIGIYRTDTTAVGGTYAIVHQGGTTTRIADVRYKTFVVRPSNNDANTMIRIGQIGDPIADPPADGVYIEKTTADSTWFYVCRSGGVQTRVDSGITLDTSNFVALAMINLGNAWRFSVQDQAITDIDTNVPGSVQSYITWGVRNTAAASKKLDITRVEFEVP